MRLEAGKRESPRLNKPVQIVIGHIARTTVDTQELGHYLVVLTRKQHHAGVPQIVDSNIKYFKGSNSEKRHNPLLPIIRELRSVNTNNHSELSETDVLFVHRGGGVYPRSKRYRADTGNVTNRRRQELLEICEEIRDLGVEVVVAIGHANISDLDRKRRAEAVLPLGLFEATTPTAGASWILQQHINPRLVDRSLIYSQERAC